MSCARVYAARVDAWVKRDSFGKRASFGKRESFGKRHSWSRRDSWSKRDSNATGKETAVDEFWKASGTAVQRVDFKSVPSSESREIKRVDSYRRRAWAHSNYLCNPDLHSPQYRPRQITADRGSDATDDCLTSPSTVMSSSSGSSETGSDDRSRDLSPASTMPPLAMPSPVMSEAGRDGPGADAGTAMTPLAEMRTPSPSRDELDAQHTHLVSELLSFAEWFRGSFSMQMAQWADERDQRVPPTPPVRRSLLERAARMKNKPPTVKDASTSGEIAHASTEPGAPVTLAEEHEDAKLEAAPREAAAKGKAGRLAALRHFYVMAAAMLFAAALTPHSVGGQTAAALAHLLC